jgi:XRE family transcriptional regulator, regulator of sulfur utilization
VDAAKSAPIVHFGEKLRAFRERFGISQEELGFLASLHRTEVGLLERGLREPRLGTVIKLAGALEVPLEDLFRGINWKPGESFKLRRLDDVPSE